MSINVLLVDDDELMSSSIRIILELESGINVVGTCKNGDEAYKMVLAVPNIDVILMDIQMPICNGVTATKKILEIYPDIKIIVLTTFGDDEYIYDALKNGAKGYMLKNVSPDKIIEAINIVYNGNLLVHPNVAEKLPCLLKDDNKVNFDKYYLTETEMEIIKLISKGLSNKEIGERIFLGEGTVKNRISEILNKLGLRDRTQIAIFYLNGGNVRL